jgi:outer membrane protein
MAGRESLRGTEQTLLQLVIQAYVAVRHDQRALAIARETLGLLERQQAEIDARYKVGEITRTDVAQTQERVSVARSLAVAAESNLNVSRASYLQTVGQPPGDLAPEPPLDKLLPKTIDAADDAVLAANPQLRQAMFAERASAARVAAAKAQTRPTLELQGSASYAGSNSGLRTPFAHFGYDLTATAVATMPISTAGVTSSLIRQAVETNSADRIAIETARRQALFSAAQAWHQMTGLLQAVTIDQQAVESARVAFEGSHQEGKLGLRSTLDVLIAEQDLFTAETTLVDAQRDAYNAEAALLAATGGLKVEAFASGVARYAPERHYERVSRTPLWSPWEPAVAAFDRLGAPGEDPPPPPPKP